MRSYMSMNGVTYENVGEGFIRGAWGVSLARLWVRGCLCGKRGPYSVMGPSQDPE